MAILTIILTATKVAGVLATFTVAANAFSYSRFRKTHLHDFQSPIDETSEILATFDVNVNEDEPGFFFGLATAPAHVEDKLDDAWIQFAEESPCDKPEIDHLDSETADALIGSASADGGSQLSYSNSNKSRKFKSVKLAMEAMIRGYKVHSQENNQSPDIECHHNVAAWHNAQHPEERLRFWSDPDTEINLAKNTGVTVFRMGIDWTRIMPKEPDDETRSVVNFAALERYKWIITRVRDNGMKVMLTLFHHSLPPWAADYGGWKQEKTVHHFLEFTRLVVTAVSELVDYWVTFNEPHVFCMLTYCAGAWPGGHPDKLEAASSALPKGVFNQSMNWISVAHNRAYDYIHQHTNRAKVGVAHHVSFMRPYGLFDVPAVTIANKLTVFPFIDSVAEKLDYVGINYYGQEVVCGAGLKLAEREEYSESGRGVYPDGLYRMLTLFHERYKHLKVPYIVTENGVSDETDVIRRPYLLEHLLAVYAAIVSGIPVVGYFFWTISDNWEWADGYGPKFGLVGVDRGSNLARLPRPSYNLFTKVVSSGEITREDREAAWNELRVAAMEKKTRPFYRAVNARGLMYAGGLDEPTQRSFAVKDWRFGHYEVDNLHDPLSRFITFVTHLLPNKIIKRPSMKKKMKVTMEPLKAL